MNWEQLLSLKRQGDTLKRLRLEQDETRIGFEVDYDRIIFSSSFRSLQDKTQVIPFSKTITLYNRAPLPTILILSGYIFCKSII